VGERADAVVDRRSLEIERPAAGRFHPGGEFLRRGRRCGRPGSCALR
jgi:hypothetical protein